MNKKFMYVTSQLYFWVKIFIDTKLHVLKAFAFINFFLINVLVVCAVVSSFYLQCIHNLITTTLLLVSHVYIELDMKHLHFSYT